MPQMGVGLSHCSDIVEILAMHLHLDVQYIG